MSRAGLRAAALAAALVLTLLSRGDVVVLGALLVLAAWRPLPAVAVVTALKATAWRWSSTALEDIAGAQAVLGPAGVVEPVTAAVAAWLGALAIVLATPNLVEAWLFERAAAGGISKDGPRWVRQGLTWLPPLAFGATAAAVVAGPAVPDDAWVRAAGTIVATGLAWGTARRRRVLNHPRVLDAMAALLGASSLVLVAVDAPPIGGVLDTDALLEGVVLAAAIALLVMAATATARRVSHERDRPIGEGRR